MKPILVVRDNVDGFMTLAVEIAGSAPLKRVGYDYVQYGGAGRKGSVVYLHNSQWEVIHQISR